MQGSAYITLLLVTLLTASCNRSGPSVSQLQERLDTVTQANKDIATASRTLRQDYQRLLDEKEKDFTAYADGIRALNDTSESIRKTMEAFANYKRDYRTYSRKNAPGTVIEDVPFGLQTLRKVTIKEVTDTHIHVLHTNGSARIPMNGAPDALQARYGFDPSLDVVLQQASGTGTDWLLSAIDAAEQYALNNAPASPSPPIAASSSPSSPASVPAPQSNYGTLSASLPTAPVYGSYYSTEPTWKRFSSFTGSYWAPLQQRKRIVGTVNTFTSSDCCY
jgi:hypothetical protein